MLKKEFLDELIGKHIDEAQHIDARNIGPETIMTADIVQDRLNLVYIGSNPIFPTI